MTPTARQTMELCLYDTLTRKELPVRPLDWKDSSIPAKRKRVRMYVCGPTVYDFAHIGNARPVIVFDVLFRLLRHLYGADHVTYVRNITDVDDKINARAAQEYPELPLNEAIRAVTTRTERQFHEDVAALGCIAPTVEPRATEHIKEMQRLIRRLLKTKRAYVLDDHILFRVERLKSYGKLSHRSLEDMRSSARGEVAPKDDPMDFVLWKPSKPGEPAWPSPARIKVPGRPGWHIECSAMSWKYLGERFDIHGGGVDLLFPHHENERAQSCLAFKRHKMAQIWMHNGFLQVEGEKMSKSLGNFVTIRELLEEFPGQAIRLAMLQTNYRQPLNWTKQRILAAHTELSQWASIATNTVFEQISQAKESGPIALDEVIVNALADDLNTSEAIAQLRKLYVRARQSPKLAVSFFENCFFLGLLSPDTLGAFLPGAATGAAVLVRYKSQIERLKAAHANRLEETEREAIEFLEKYGVGVEFRRDGYPILSARDQSDIVEQLIAARASARARKDFVESDRIRDELAAMGVTLKDSKEGTTWEIAR
jgi:cysteinyl-tRNA synthetase